MKLTPELRVEKRHLLHQLCVLRVRVRQPDNDDGTAQIVGEIYAFTHFASDHAQEQTAASAGHGSGEGGENLLRRACLSGLPEDTLGQRKLS